MRVLYFTGTRAMPSLPCAVACCSILALVACGARTGLDRFTSAELEGPGSDGAIRQVSVWGSTCAVMASGGVMCLGENRYGTLGNGSTTDSTSPAGVAGLGSGVSAVSVRDYATCAVTTSGGVKCWGTLSLQGVGDPVTAIPTDLSGLPSPVSAVSVGQDHACALTTGGAAMCWGANSFGQLGDGYRESSSLVPVGVSGLASGVSAISAGFDHTCALMTEGTVRCWGANGSGQLGDGTTTTSPVPVDVRGIPSPVSAVSAGDGFACAIASGGVKCWGLLGSHALMDSPVPVDVAGVAAGVLSISAGLGHACALMTSGGIKCWGANPYGGLGDDSTRDSSAAVDVVGLGSGVSRIAAGAHQTCALVTSGRVLCWGLNYWPSGGSGGTIVQNLVPAEVTGW